MVKLNNLKKVFIGIAAAVIMTFGLTVPGHAAGLYTTQYFYFTWMGQTYKIPVKQVNQTVQEPVQQVETTTTTTETSAPEVQQEEVKVPSQAQAVVDLVNAERSKEGLAPLKINTSLADMAKVKAEDMRDGQYFSHTSPTYGSPFDMMKQFGISYSYAGENIAAGQKTPEEVMKGWMNSPGHRANIMSPNYTEIGVGFAEGGSYGTYWVQEFIKQ